MYDKIIQKYYRYMREKTYTNLQWIIFFWIWKQNLSTSGSAQTSGRSKLQINKVSQNRFCFHSFNLQVLRLFFYRIFTQTLAAVHEITDKFILL